MESFISIDPNSLSTSDLHKMLLLSVAPRPIALASTIDDNGTVNLSPFSCFNMFSANPPILIFSPSPLKTTSSKILLSLLIEIFPIIFALLAIYVFCSILGKYFLYFKTDKRNDQTPSHTDPWLSSLLP